MQIISTEIETRIHFDYRLYQSLLVQQLRLGHGSGDVTLKGFVGMAVDLSTLGEAAILKCDGAFGVNDLVVDVHTDILGAKLGIDTVDGARANTTQYIIEQFMPLIAQQLDEIICNGDGLVDVRLYNSVSGGYVDSFPGLAHSINVALADQLSLTLRGARCGRPHKLRPATKTLLKRPRGLGSANDDIPWCSVSR